MFEQDAYGHFGVPDTLSKNYGADENQTSNTTALYVPQGRTLPVVKGGATNAMVQQDTGIENLISEIQRKMGVSVTGKLVDSEIRAYQQQKGLLVDGLIGRETYTALGLGQYAKSTPKQAYAPVSASPVVPAVIPPQPFYKQGWFLYSVSAIVLVGAGYMTYQYMQEKK